MSTNVQLCVVGASCGKTRLIQRLINDTFVDEDDPTLLDNYSTSLEVDGTPVNLAIQDVSGDAQYESSYDQWFADQDGFVFVFNLGDMKSFDALVRIHQHVQRIKRSPKIPMVLVGTASDLDVDDFVVLDIEGLSVALVFGCEYMTASALNGENVTEVFQQAVREVLTAKENAPEIGAVLLQKGRGWKERAISVDKDSILNVFNDEEEAILGKPPLESINLLTCTIKPGTDIKKPHCFCIVAHTGDRLNIQAASADDLARWTQVVTNAILQALNNQTSVKSSSEEKNGMIEGKEAFRRLRQYPYLRECADCGFLSPDWASINLAITLCIQCSGIHRSLGVHISKVRSLTLDEWDPELLGLMVDVGNVRANSVWEAVPCGIAKPAPDADRAEKEAYVYAKYVEKRMLPPSYSQIDPAAIPTSLANAVVSGAGEEIIGLVACSSTLDSYVELPAGCGVVGQGTPLHVASIYGAVSAIEYLCQNGATVEVADSNGYTPFQLAVGMGNTRAAVVLIKLGAVTGVAESGITVDLVRDEGGQGPAGAAAPRRKQATRERRNEVDAGGRAKQKEEEKSQRLRDMMSSTAKSEEVMKHHRAKVAKIDRRLTGYKGKLETETRRLIREGVLIKTNKMRKKQARTFFLFNDCIVYGEEKAKNQVAFKGEFTLDMAEVVATSDKDETAFAVRNNTKKKVLSLNAPDEFTRVCWVEDIAGAIEECDRVRRMGVDPDLLDDDGFSNEFGMQIDGDDDDDAAGGADDFGDDDEDGFGFGETIDLGGGMGGGGGGDDGDAGVVLDFDADRLFAALASATADTSGDLSGGGNNTSHEADGYGSGPGYASGGGYVSGGDGGGGGYVSGGDGGGVATAAGSGTGYGDNYDAASGSGVAPAGGLPSGPPPVVSVDALPPPPAALVAPPPAQQLPQARMLYAFTPSDGPPANQIPAAAGELVTIVNSTDYGGWVVALNAAGAEGVVPRTYVEGLS